MIAGLVSSLKKSELFKNISILLSGSILAQILGLLLTPVLTRLFSPEDFGIYQMFITSTGITAALFCLRYDAAIVLPKTEKDFSQLLGTVLKIFTVNSILLLILLALFPSVLSSLGFQSLNKYWYVLYFAVLMLSSQLVISQVITRCKLFKFSAQAKSIFVVLRFVITCIVFIIVKGPFGLLVGFTLAHLIVNIINVYRIYNKNCVSINFNETTDILKSYIDFPINNTVATVLNLFITQLPIIFLAKYYSDEHLGQFSLAFRMMMLPISTVNAAVSNVFLKKIADLKNNRGNATVFLKKSLFMLACSFPVFLFVYIFGGVLFETIFGSEWAMAGEISEILSPYLYFSFITSPLSVVFIVYKKNAVFSLINVLFLSALFGIFSFCNNNGFVGLIRYYSIANISYYLVVLCAIFSIVKVKYDKKAKS